MLSPQTLFMVFSEIVRSLSSLSFKPASTPPPFMVLPEIVRSVVYEVRITAVLRSSLVIVLFDIVPVSSTTVAEG
jgi:hypothetical protein